MCGRAEESSTKHPNLMKPTKSKAIARAKARRSSKTIKATVAKSSKPNKYTDVEEFNAVYSFGGTPKPLPKMSKRLRKWIDSQNQIALQQPMRFEPELAKITQQTIERYHPDLVWDVSNPLPLGRVIASIPDERTPDLITTKASSKLASALVDGLTEQIQTTIEDVLIATLTPLVAKYGPVLAKRALQNLDIEIVDFILERQIWQKQQAIEESHKQINTLQKWKQPLTASEKLALQ